MKQNPSLAEARLSSEQGQVGYEGAAAWAPPRLSVTQLSQPMETSMGLQTRTYSLTQPVPFPGSGWLLEDIAQAKTEALQHQEEWTKRRIIAEVKSVYYDLWQLQATPELIEENEQISEKIGILGGLERRVETLKVVLTAQAKLGENGKILFDLEQKALAARYHLSHLLGQGSKLWNGKVQDPGLPELKTSLSKLLAAARDYFPRLRAQDKKAQAAKAQARYHEYQAWVPEFSFGLNYTQNDPLSDGTKGQNSTSLSLGMSLPFGNGEIGTKKRQAQLEEEKQQLQYEEESNQLEADLAQAYAQAQQAYKLVALYQEELLPPARQQISIAQRMYKTGKSGAIEALAASAQMIGLKVGELQAKSDYLKSLVRLELFTGLILTESE